MCPRGIALLAILLASLPVVASGVLAASAPPAEGNWVVSADELVEGRDLALASGVVVRDGGRLTIRDATVAVGVGGTVLVERGGALILEPGATIRAADPSQPYAFTVQGALEAVGRPESPAIIENAGGRYPQGGVFVETDADGVVLRHAVVRDTSTRGLYVGSNTSVRVEDSVFLDTGQTGLEFAGRLRGVVARNVIDGAVRGIEVRSHQPDLVMAGNEVRGARVGLTVSGGHGLTVTDHASVGGSQGLLVQRDATVRLVNASFEGQGLVGAVFTGNASGEVVASRFIAYGSTGAGIQLDGAGEVAVSESLFRGYRNHGVDCGGGSMDLQDNRFVANGGWGVRALGCAIRLGGNDFGEGAAANRQGRVLLATPASVAVVDAEGRAVDGARVRVTDASGELVLDDETDETGRAPGFLATTYRDAGGATVRAPLAVQVDGRDTGVVARYSLERPRDLVFTVAPQPDLVVSGLQMTPAEPVDGEAVTIAVTVENRGGAEAPPSVVAVLAPGNAPVERPVPALVPGAAHEVEASWSARAGRHDVVVLADAGDAVEEAGESNGARVGEVRVGGVAPNGTSGSEEGLTVRARLATDGAREGRPVALAATVENGGAVAVGPFTVVLRDGGVPVARIARDGLQPGTATTVGFASVLPAGVRSLTVDVEGAGSNASGASARLEATVEAAIFPAVRPQEAPGDGWTLAGPGPVLAVAGAALAALAAARRKRNV